jgi:hypothetical protein
VENKRTYECELNKKVDQLNKDSKYDLLKTFSENLYKEYVSRY